MLLNQSAIPGITQDSWLIERIPSMTAYKMFYYIQSGGHFFCTKEYAKNRAGYDSVLLLYTRKGTGYLEYKGKKHLLPPDAGFIIDCNYLQSYGFHCEKEEALWEFLFLHFNGSESKKYVSRIIENASPVFRTDGQSCIPSVMENLLSMLQSHDARLDAAGSALLLQILTELYLKSSMEPESKSVLPETVSDILYIIERRYSERISLDDLSGRLKMSKYHMLRVFKKHTGYTIHEYLLKYRLNQAKTLLRDTGIPVEEVSRSVGFDDCSHFCRLFKCSEKMTPSGFRESWR